MARFSSICAIAGSPSWHRKARSAQARRRVHTCQLLGRAASARDLLRLQSHHSAPHYSVGVSASSMKWGQYGSQSGSGWDYWHGSQQYRWKKEKKEKANAGGQPDPQTILVPYDKVKVAEKDTKAAEALSVAGQGASGVVPDTLLRD